MGDFFTARPKSVALIGLGPTRQEFVNEVATRHTTWDHIWTINTGSLIFRHDAVFAMDDLRLASSHPWVATLKNHDKPVITSTAYLDLAPTSLTYPLEVVAGFLNDDFFPCSVTYAVAWAFYIGVERFDIFGCDFWYPNMPQVREEGSQSVAYLMGRMKQAGIDVRACRNSTLLGMNTIKQGRRPLYGYHDVIPLSVSHAHLV